MQVHEVAIVGAGFGGLGMAIRLKQEGTNDFVVIERGDDVGLVGEQLSGLPVRHPVEPVLVLVRGQPNWDRAYPMRDQILGYLRDCTERFGILPHTRLNCELLGAIWVAHEQCWELETSTGPLTARVLVAAPGLLSEPSRPSLPGLERFTGNAFHTANWDHSDNLAGKRVALLGSGATAVQVVPEIQPRVAKLHLFQRTPPWVIPHMDHAVARGMRELYRRAPYLQKLSRAGIYAPEVQAAYNEELQERLAETVWNRGGCGSWYIDRNGRNSIQWPGFTFEYRRRTRQLDAESYRFAAPVLKPAAAAAPAA